MNERQAQREGLSFTGNYCRTFDRDQQRETAKEIRTKAKRYGFDIRIVMVEKEHGSSLYADAKYRECEAFLDAIRDNKYLVEHQKELIQAKQDAADEAIEKLNELHWNIRQAAAWLKHNAYIIAKNERKGSDDN